MTVRRSVGPWTPAVHALLRYLEARGFDGAPRVLGFDEREREILSFAVGAPTSGEVICHNDLAPWNTVFVDGRPVAFIDWDFAAPGPRLWDVAYALWRFAPLYAHDQFGPPAERARHITVFCDAYGLHDQSDVLATIERRQRVLYDTVVAWG